MAPPGGPTIAIVGSGFGGLTFSIKLLRELGYENFIIFEKDSQIGGTWRDNVYPGCSSDVPMAFYILSTDLHNWPGTHGSQSEIFAYLQGLVSKYNLLPHIHFNQEVISATWDSDSSRYAITTLNTVTGEEKVTYAEILVSAVGVLGRARYPNIEGLGTFKGAMFHSAKWDWGVSLKGKRVAVIGNGTSAGQFVPKITEDPSVQVVNFCRTPNWYMPPIIRSEYSSFQRWYQSTIPGWKRLMRVKTYLLLEFVYLLTFSIRLRMLRPLVHLVASSYMKWAAPKKDLPHIFPAFPVGCKRMIWDAGYIPALHRPNLNLDWDGIDSIVEEGIVSKKDGRVIPFDVIILATGFAADVYPLNIQGRDGVSVNGYFEEQKGAKAYLGTTIPSVPNFILLLGPNTNTGHTSNVYSMELQSEYAFQLIKPILDGEIKLVEVKSKPTDEWDNHIQERLKGSVFHHCVSWYRIGGQGKISNIYPGSNTRMWWDFRKVNWDHYTFSPAGWRPKRIGFDSIGALLYGLGALACVALGLSVAR